MNSEPNEEEEELPKPPVTTLEDLENGLFQLVITYVQSLCAGGQSKETAVERTAQLLERYANALRTQQGEK